RRQRAGRVAGRVADAGAVAAPELARLVGERAGSARGSRRQPTAPARHVARRPLEAVDPERRAVAVGRAFDLTVGGAAVATEGVPVVALLATGKIDLAVTAGA